MRKWIVMAAGVAMLAFVNFGIFQREQLLAEGRVVLLELAPVDPRSLMQGDYMALRFKVANDAFPNADAIQREDGHIVVALDAQRIGHFRRFADGGPVAADEALLRYRIRNGRPKFATNAFFFEEGQAKVYEAARYGEFRVSGKGEMILTAMRGADFRVLGTAQGAGGIAGQ